jgi:hypothetical protein
MKRASRLTAASDRPRRSATDIVRQHRRRSGQDHRSGHERGQQAGGADQSDEPGIEGLDRQPQERQVDLVAPQPRNPKQRGEADEEDDERGI